MECVTGFSLQEVVLLLGAVMGAVGLPAGIQFRAMREDNKFLRQLVEDQMDISRDQNETQKETVKVIRQRRS